MMEYRYRQLENTISALNETNIPLTSLVNNSYTPAGFTDDLGIYYFIPWIAKFLGISLDPAINIFFGLLLFIGITISLCCFSFAFKQGAARMISSVGLGLLMIAAYRYSDVYSTSYFAIASTIPLFILWDQKSSKFDWKFIALLAFSGIIIGYSNIIRTHAGTGVFLFLVSWLLLNKELTKTDKLISLITLTVFIGIPYGHFKFLETNRDAFLTKIDPLYQPISIAHPKWHSIYIGFGFLDNKYGIKYSDIISQEKAMSINPKAAYCSPEYEQILKNQCFLLAKNDPKFVLKTVFMKSITLFFRFLQFANFGLLIAFFYVKPSARYVIPFIIAALFYSIPGILTMPINVYVSGLANISGMFGIYMICLGIKKYGSSAQGVFTKNIC